jgi:hypothetical protein
VIATAFAHPFARLVLAVLALAGLTSCGSGAVANQVTNQASITILPGTAILYSGMPTTFTISGGTGAYIVASSNQSIVPISGTSNGNLIIAPNPVSAETTVTLTVRDTGTAPQVSATLTVRPNTVNNSITVTPTATQGGSCSPAVCSGGDAEVVATISQGGIPLAARGVRLTVVSGDYRFIVTAVGATSELLATTVDVVTDETGKARARIRVLADAPNQTAELEVMDLGNLAFQRTSFIIAQATGTSPGFFVSPTTMTFTGATTGQCANNLGGQFFIFGGNPPYTVLNSASSAFIVTDLVVLNSGDSVALRTTGVCASNLPITVRDSAGHTATVTVSNVPGTVAPATLTVAPDTVTLFSCSSTANVTVSGGLGSYFVSNGDAASFVVTISGHTVTIRRRIYSVPQPGPTTTSIGVSDGQTSATITVNDSGLPC